MAKSNYENMTIDQLEEANRKLMAEKQALRSEQLRLHAVLDRKIARRRAEDIAATLGDDEKRELAQVIGPQGVETDEGVGTPTAS